MTCETVIARIRDHEPELRGLGVVGLAVFGSTARGTQTAASDIDIAVQLEEIPSGLAMISRLARIRERLALILEVDVDIVLEPRRPGRLQAAIEKDLRRAF